VGSLGHLHQPRAERVVHQFIHQILAGRRPPELLSILGPPAVFSQTKEWISVLRAADAAARWHVHQRRRGIAQEPYINLLLEVASLVTEETGGSDPNLVIAALLHDSVEDQEVPLEIIARDFGAQVADIVMEVTDDKSLPKEDASRLKPRPRRARVRN
jgi:(p)ppGpp synthase/HD superfamily hydrolase